MCAHNVRMHERKMVPVEDLVFSFLLRSMYNAEFSPQNWKTVTVVPNKKEFTCPKYQPL